MPTSTFENLPAVRRQAIINLAIEEFGEHPYALASLSQIVARAGISKGSMYQYFANKQDLFLFVVEYAAQQQLQLLSQHTPPDSERDFFALLRWQLQVSVQVGLAAPAITRLLYRAVSDDVPFGDEVTQRLGALRTAHLQELLQRGVERGEINPTVDLELAAFVLQGLTANLRELILRRVGTTMASATQDVRQLASTEADQIYDQIVHILQWGLAAKR